MFIIDVTTNKVVSAIGIIPGKKGEPYTEGMLDGYGLEIDGILAEFNIPPCTNKDEFVSSIMFMKDYIRNHVKQFNPNYDILCKASSLVPKDQLLDPLANLIGCMPDFNVYTERENPKPEGYKNRIRVSGFHLHLGYDNPNIKTSLQLIRYMDAYVGIPSILYDTDIWKK